VRAERLPPPSDQPGEASGASVTDLDAPARVGVGQQFDVRVTVRNDGPARTAATVPVQWRDRTREVRVDLPPGGQRTVTVTVDAGAPGTATLDAGDVTKQVRVVDPDSLVLRAVPERAPPRSDPLVRVVDGTGAPADGATLTVRNDTANRTVRTGGDGRARLPFGGPGEYTVVATRGEARTSTAVAVDGNVTRDVRATLQVTPDAPTVLTRPAARLSLRNPWNGTLNRSVVLEGPGARVERSVSFGPGESRTINARLPQRPPGEYTVTVRADDRTLSTVGYAVRGDDRIASALASSGQRGTTGIGQAIDTVFGNLQLVGIVLLALAGLMTVGGTTATFAGAVHARRRSIGVHRATGASPTALVRLVVGDAVRIGAVAACLALVAGVAVLHLLSLAGLLTVFGVSLPATPSPAVAAGTVVGGLALTVLGAGLTTASLLARPPADLLSGRRGTRDGGEPRE